MNTMHDRIKESDWKKFKHLQPLALQRYCDRMMKEVDAIIQDSDNDSYDRYCKMYKTVRDGDKKMARMFDGFSRSKALTQLAMYVDDGLLDDEEIAELSGETKEQIYSLVDFWRG